MSAASDLDFPILGRPFRARAVPPLLAEWLHRHWHFPDRTAPRSPHAISLDFAAHAPAVGSGVAPHRVRLHGGVELCWWNHGSEWWAGSAEAGVRLVAEPAESRVTAWGVEEGGPLAALHLAISEALRMSGLLPLHAAVAVREGRATAFAGPSGVGKTTTLLSALSAGWTPLAEDLSWLDPGELVLYGWDRGIRLWPDGRDRVAAVLPGGAGEWETEADGKLLLPYPRLGAEAVRTGALARFALLVRDPAAESALEPLPPREAVRAIWEATGVPLTPAARSAAAEAVGTLLARLDLRRLRLGSTPLPL